MKINNTTRLLVVSPHPDDEALGIGGLIGKVKKEGGSTMILYMCVGDSRQLSTGKTESNIRLAEIENVKKLTGADVKIMYVGKEFTRLDTVPQKDLIENIEDAIQEFKPNIIGVPSSSSYNQDHRETYDACITALRPTPKDTRHFIDHVIEYPEPYFWSAREQKKPTMYLDLSEQFDGKNLFEFAMDLYRCHATQVREDPFPRSIANLERLAHIYGREIGVSMAEAYHVLRTTI